MSLVRKLLDFYAIRFPVNEKLDGIAIGISQHRDDLPLAARPVPMWKKMQYGFIAPLALIKIIPIFRAVGHIYLSRKCAFSGPPRLTKIINTRPHKITYYIIMHINKLPQLLCLYHA